MIIARSDYANHMEPLVPIVANLLWTHPAFLHTLCNHDDVMDVLLPDHLPEVVLSPRKRALRGDVLPAEVVSLEQH